MNPIERTLIGGDVSQLTEADRLTFYKSLCDSLGLNPLTKPFEYIELNGKLTLYTKKDCTDQLRQIHNISVKIMSREVVEGVYVVTSQARTPEGREDESIGAVPIVKEGGQWETASGGKRYFKGNGEYVPLKPEDRANAIMKSETKSKRRVTLSICGLGMLDESEIEGVPGARRVDLPEETQEQVAERRIAEERTKSAELPHKQWSGQVSKPASDKPQAEEIPPAVQAMWKRMTNVKGICEVFEYLKGTPGDDAEWYYTILKKYGMGHANDCRKVGMELSRQCARELFEWVQQWQAKQEASLEDVSNDAEELAALPQGV